MIITLSGAPGSGKSSIGQELATRLNLQHFSTGRMMRAIARERNLSLEDLNRIAESDISLDQQLDKRQLELGKNNDDFVIDGRIAFHFIPQSIKIFLTADLKVRAQRIWEDITVKNRRKTERGETIREIIEEIRIREESEKKRYQKAYQVNPFQEEHYDLVFDTTTTTKEEAAEQIIAWIRKTYKTPASPDKNAD